MTMKKMIITAASLLFLLSAGIVSATGIDFDNTEYPVIRGEGVDIGVSDVAFGQGTPPTVIMRIWDIDAADSARGRDENYRLMLGYAQNYSLAESYGYFRPGGEGGREAFDNRVTTVINPLRAFAAFGWDIYGESSPNNVDFWFQEQT